MPEALFCGGCGISSEAPAHLRERMRDPRPLDTAVIDAEALRNTCVFMNATSVPHVLEPCEMPTNVTEPPDGRAGLPFTLSISDGQRVVVSGTGILGRRPCVGEGEVFDHFVNVVDVSRSVSKTHLEFGCDDVSLWLLDRFSCNGSVLESPNEPSITMEPGRRYHVRPGARVVFGGLSLLVE